MEPASARIGNVAAQARRTWRAAWKSLVPGGFGDKGFHGGKSGHRHQTDVLALHKPRPRPAMTK